MNASCSVDAIDRVLKIDPTVSTLGTDLKPDSVPVILESNRPHPTRFSVPILGIESNRQETVIMPRFSIFGFKFSTLQANSINIV
jgi:hypothetical protein